MKQFIQGWIQPVREHWTRLAPRERTALKVLGAGLLATIAYLAVLSPFSRSLDKLRAEAPQERLQLSRMREQAALVNHLKRAPTTAPVTGNPVTQIELTATAHNLNTAFTKIEPDGTNGATIQVEGAPFNTLLAWMADIQKQSSLRVVQAVFDAHATAGTVNARMTLRAVTP